MTTQCPKCNSENTDTARFCSNCAASLLPSEKVPVPTQTIEAPKEELTTGSTFAGRYQIIEELGKGGMGKVYKALDKEINAKIALKLIKPEIASDKNTIERFRNELKTARDIAHKNVCRMYDLNKEEGSYYITMEYVSGEDLKSFIRRSKQLAIGTAISIAKQVSDGLAEAHRLGVAHRDLKPSNIMIDRDGNVRIMDFGIARSLSGRGITDRGVMIGTPDYMSPEQVEGKDIDQRTDIYSLGVILYEMVTGKVPFEGETALSIAHKHKYETPQAPKIINPQIPDDLNSIILKCLEKDKEKRYQSADEVRTELTNIEESIPTTQRVVHEKKPMTSREITVQFNVKKLIVPAAIFIGMIIIGLTVWQILPEKKAAPVPTEKPSLAIMYFKNNTGDEGLDHWRTMLTDLLIKDLAQSRYIRVLSEDKLIDILEKQNQLEAKSYSTDVLKEVATQGRVNHILQGNYAKAGDAYRVNVTLQEADKMEIIASEGVEGTGEDNIFAMVDELTRKIKARFKLSSEEMSTDIDREVGKITTSSPEAYKFYREGLKVGERGDIGKSLQFFEKAVSIDPDFASAYIQMAIAYYNLRLFNEEKSYLQKAFALRDRISDRERYWSEAELYSTSERTYDQAIDAFEKLLALYPDDSDGNAELGWVYMQLEKYDEAIKLYEIVIQNKSEDISCYSNLASCYQAKGMYDRGRQLLESYFNDYRDNARIRHSLASLFIRQGELDLALAQVDKAFLLDPAHFLNFGNRGDIFLYKGDFVKAEEEYQNLSEAREPVGRGWRFWKLGSLRTLQGRFADAMVLAKEGVESAEKSGQYVWKTLTHSGLSYLFTKTGNPEAGLRENELAWKSAVEADYIAGQKDALFIKGLAYLEMGSISKSLEVAEELKIMIENGMNENSLRMYYHLMARIELQRKNFAEAREYIEKALSLTFYGPLTKDADYIDTLAAAYYGSGDLVNAFNQYERITRLTTGRLEYGDIYAKSFYMLGKIYEQQGNKAKAIENYQKFLDLWKDADPGIAEVDDARERRAKLLKSP